MYEPACIVEVEHGDRRGSCSAVYLHDDLVLTVASVLLPVLQPNNGTSTLRSLLSSRFHSSRPFQHIKVSVIFQKQGHFNSNTYESTDNIVLANGCNKKQRESSTYFAGSILCVWKYENFAKILKKIFPNYAKWNLHESLESNVEDNDKQNMESNNCHEHLEKILSHFMLIKLYPDEENNRILKTTSIINPHQLHLGAWLSIQATPFGSLTRSVLGNSVSSGVLSNMAGRNKELLLTDARCLPGCEGGPLYFGPHQRGPLLGVIVSPLTWKGNEWIGLSVACAVQPLLNSLQEHHPLVSLPLTNGDGTPPSEYTESGWMAAALRGVVLVQSAGTWGTGVVLDSSIGLVVTCNHVVKKAKTVDVRVGDVWVTGEVVYSRDDEAPYDVALLMLRPIPAPLNTSLNQFQMQHPKQGQRAYVVGHALFGKELSLAPSVTSGVVSTVVRHHSAPVLLQMTCAVHAGASGGAVLDDAGHLLAIIVCNARDKETGCSYPHISLGVPIQAIWSRIKCFINTKDRRYLSELKVKDEEVQRIWRLQEDRRAPCVSKL